MLIALFAAFSCSIDICVSSNLQYICPSDALTISSIKKIDDILKILNSNNNEDRHINIFIENTHKTPIFLNLNEFKQNSLTATLKGKKESSFVVIDFCGQVYKDKSVFSYEGVTVHPKNANGFSFGCIYTKNVDFQFPGFDSGKIYSKHLTKKIFPKSIISFNRSGNYEVYEFSLFPQISKILISRKDIILSTSDGHGTMKIEDIPKSTVFINQNEFMHYEPLTIFTDVTDEIDLPFLCLKVAQSTNITLGKFPKQPSGIPPFGIDIQTLDEVTINGASAANSKFVLFDTEPLKKKTLKVKHADICPHHYGEDESDKLSFIFKNLTIDYGSFVKITKSSISIEADQVQSIGYSFRQVDEFKSLDNKIFQKVVLSQGMNYLKLTDKLFTISEGKDKPPKFQANSSPNLNILVLQNDESPSILTIDTQSSTSTLNNLPNIELVFSKQSTLNVVSNLQNNQNSHFQIFGDNFGKPVTIQSSNSNGFTFGITDDITGDFIIDGAKIELQNVELVNVGQLYIKKTEFVKMSQESNPTFSVGNLYVNSDFVSQIPQLSVISNFHILGDIKSGQNFLCSQGLNVYLDIPAGFGNVEINSPDILLYDSNRQKIVTFTNISNDGHIFFAQKSASPTSYSLNLAYKPDQNENQSFGVAVFEFAEDSSVHFIGSEWNDYYCSNQSSLIVELISNHRLSAKMSGNIPAKIVSQTNGELSLVPSNPEFGLKELHLSGKMAISHDKADKFTILLETFSVDSTTSFQLEKVAEINATELVFELGTFGLLNSQKVEFVSEPSFITLRGDTELKTDYSLNFRNSSIKQFTLIGQTAKCSLSIENEINYRKDGHTLTFKKFDKDSTVYFECNNSKIETEITSLHLSMNSSFVFDNTIVLRGVVTMDYKSAIYAYDSGKIIFSKSHDFITYYNLANKHFPMINSEKVPFEGSPFALSLWHPGGKEPGRNFRSWIGHPARVFCSPSFECENFISVVDVEHPFNDTSYSFKPTCVNYQDKKCLAFEVVREKYVPTPTRLPMPSELPPATTKKPAPSSSVMPSSAEITVVATESGGGDEVVPDDSKKRKIKKAGMIAGIVIAAVVVVVGIAVLVWYLRKKARDDGFVSFDSSMKVKLIESNAL